MKFIGEKKYVSHSDYQLRVWRLFGFIPILLMRKAKVPNIGTEWVWSRWKPAGYFDVWLANGIIRDHEEKIRASRESV